MSRYFEVILEEIRDQNRAVLEAVGVMQRQVAKLTGIEDDVHELKSDMKVVKAAITDIGGVLQDHERHISKLEGA